MKYSLLFFISLFSSYADAAQTPGSGIEVIGKASVKMQPDQFSFTVSIIEHGVVASKAKALVDQKSRFVVDKYLSLGINESSIDSSRLQLIPRYEKTPRVPEFEVHQRVKNRTGNSNVNSTMRNAKVEINGTDLVNSSNNNYQKIYFEVSRTITVTFTDFEKYDQLLDHVVKIGVTRISPLQTMTINSEAFYQQALTDALRNATQKAKRIVQQIGMKLGNITHLRESAYHAPRAYMMASESSSGFSSQVTKKSISAQVDVTFSINENK